MAVYLMLYEVGRMDAWTATRPHLQQLVSGTAQRMLKFKQRGALHK